MARFYATVINGRGSETAVGGRASVDRAHIRGWDVGIEVETIKLTDGDALDIYLTGGSHKAGRRHKIGRAYFQRGETDTALFTPTDDVIALDSAPAWVSYWPSEEYDGS